MTTTKQLRAAWLKLIRSRNRQPDEVVSIRVKDLEALIAPAREGD